MNVHTMLRILVVAGFAVALATPALADEPHRFLVELEGGPVWQSRNDVQIPNDASGTRFSLVDLAGSGPLPGVRLYVTWNLSERHGVRLLLAPLSYTETGQLDEPVNFAGESYLPGADTEATYRFNSWRVGYRYRLHDSVRWTVWIGGTIKIRDALIELSQGDRSSRDTDVGIVPLLHFAVTWRPAGRWSVLFDFEGLAGGPGRALDGSLKLAYELSERWSLAAGYRALEGGADVDDVYSCAWFNGAVLSGSLRF